MHFINTLSLLALPLLVVAQDYTVPPPTTAPSGTILDCTNWHVGASGDTCAALADNYFITLAQLYRYNPSLATTCNIISGTSYCVEENWSIPPPETTTTTRSASTTSATPTGLATPSPLQPPGAVAGCTKFYFVESGTSCSAVLSQNSITLPQLFAWNSGVNADCSGLWANVYVCVAGPALATTTTSRTTTRASATTAANGIVTPSPTQPPSIISNCNKFFFVAEGTSCTSVLSQNSISLAQLYAWNSGVNADCTGLWSNVYVCVGAIGQTTTTTPRPSTTSAGGIATPTPTQPGMINTCQQFYFVAPGQTCNQVLAANSLSLAQLYSWNTGVNADCSGLWTNVYVCVRARTGIVTTTTTTTTRRATTTTGNGIATPTPTMPGMVSNCRRFYKVVSGDYCDVIVSKTGVSKANIISWNRLDSACNVWLDTYICIGV